MPTFIISCRDKEIGTYSFSRDRITIGRSRENTVCIGDSSASRNHCLIQRKSNDLYLSDLGSRNGTFLNNKRVSGYQLLHEGDTITVGSHSLVVHLDEQADSTGKKTESIVLEELSAAGNARSNGPTAPHATQFDENYRHETQVLGLTAKTYHPTGVNALVLELAGKLARENAETVEALFQRLDTAETPFLIIDLRGVGVITSIGWTLLAIQLKEVRDRGITVMMAGMIPAIDRQFRMLAMNEVFQRFPTVKDALRTLPAEKQVHDSFPAGEKPDSASSAGESSDKAEKKSGDSRNKHKQKQQTPGLQPPDTLHSETPSRALPLPELIMAVIATYGPVSLLRIRTLLRLPENGSHKIGLIKLYRTLKKLNLETMAKRDRFYRSC